MKKFIVLFLLFFVFAAVVSPAASGDYAQEILKIVNRERGQNGLKPLTLNNTLLEIAQIRADECTRKYSHTRPDGTPWDSLLEEFDVRWSANGENIAEGYQNSQKVMEGWLKSPGHRANILSDKFTHLGVGVARSSNGKLYWVQVFIRR